MLWYAENEAEGHSFLSDIPNISSTRPLPGGQAKAPEDLGKEEDNNRGQIVILHCGGNHKTRRWRYVYDNDSPGCSMCVLVFQHVYMFQVKSCLFTKNKSQRSPVYVSVWISDAYAVVNSFKLMM